MNSKLVNNTIQFLKFPENLSFSWLQLKMAQNLHFYVILKTDCGLKHTQNKNGPSEYIFRDTNFAKITLRIKSVWGCKWVKYQRNFFLFLPIRIIKAIFNRLNLRLSQKVTQLDTFLSKLCCILLIFFFVQKCKKKHFEWDNDIQIVFVRNYGLILNSFLWTQ